MAAKKKVDGRTKKGREQKAKLLAKAAKRQDAKAKKPVKKAVRGTTKKTVGKAKLTLQKQEASERPPRIGQVVLFTEGEGRKLKFGIGYADSVVGEVVNIRVGGDTDGRWVHAARERTYRPMPTEKSLHSFLCESIRLAFEQGFKKGEHSALGKTHSVAHEDDKAFKKDFVKVAGVDSLMDVLEEREKQAAEHEKKADDLSILYAAYAMQSPKAQQVVEHAAESLDSDVRVSPDPEAAREETNSFTGNVEVKQGSLGQVSMFGDSYEVRDDGVLAFVHEELTEEQKLEVVREVQKAPLL